MLTIGKLSRRTGVNIETIRYYERVGLLPTPGRTESGRRLYDESDSRRLAFVRHARELGFEMATIRALLALQDKPERSCAEVTEITRLQLTAVESRIERLCGLKEELVRMINACAGGKVANCRIIDALSAVSHPACETDPISA